MNLKSLWIFVSLFILLINCASGLDMGYPIIGRFIGPVEFARLEFNDCFTQDLPIENGELVFTVDESSDIVDINGKSCVSKIKYQSKFKVFLRISGCDELEYGEFILDDSAAYIGTHQVEGCEIVGGAEYRPVPVSSGSSNSGHVVVVEPEELDEIITSPVNDLQETNLLPIVEDETPVYIEPSTAVYSLSPLTLLLIVLIFLTLFWFFYILITFRR